MVKQVIDGPFEDTVTDPVAYVTEISYPIGQLDKQHGFEQVTWNKAFNFNNTDIAIISFLNDLLFFLFSVFVFLKQQQSFHIIIKLSKNANS